MSQYNLHLSESDFAIIEDRNCSLYDDEEEVAHAIMEYTAWVDFKGKPKHFYLTEKRKKEAKAYRERVGII